MVFIRNFLLEHFGHLSKVGAKHNLPGIEENQFLFFAVETSLIVLAAVPWFLPSASVYVPTHVLMIRLNTCPCSLFICLFSGAH